MDKGIKDLDSIELRKRTYASLCLRGLMISGLLGTIMLTSTNPVIGGPKVILVFLSIVFIFLFCLYCLLIQIIIRIAGYGTRALDTRLIYCSIILAIGSIFLIGLQTLGQLGLADIVLVSTFVAILMFYIIRRF